MLGGKKRDTGEQMVDNRSAGFFGIGGGFNFKSGDISGTAAKTADDRQSNGTDYFDTRRDGEAMEGQMNNSPYVDRSAQLNATLNSLAMMNVANLIKKANQKSKKADEDSEEKSDLDKIPVWEDYRDENEDFLYVD